MGKGAHNPVDSLNADEQQQTKSFGIDHRLPTLSEIKLKLPAHCFRSTVRQSMSYVIKDIIYVVLTFCVMYQLQKIFTFGFLFFPLYWYIQGLSIHILRIEN
jgi:hypothetical protein